MRKILSAILILASGLHKPVLAQTGGETSFAFLNLVAPARASALGGNAIATRADDITLSAQNPALLSPETDQQISFSHVFHLAGISYGNLMAAKDLKKTGTVGFNMQYISYGKFDQTNVNSEKTGEFTAAEYAFNAMFSKALDSSLFVGASVKAIFSNFAGNTASGIGADVGVNWIRPASFWSFSLVAIYRDWETDRKSTRLNSSHSAKSRMPSSA